MDGTTSALLASVAEIFATLALGWLARWSGRIRAEDLGPWSAFVIDFMFPALVVSSIVGGLEPADLGELWPLPVLGFAMVAAGWALGVPLKRGLVGADEDLRKTFHHFCAVNNFGFLPIIIVGRLWGGAGLAHLFLLNLGTSVGVWTIGVGILAARPAGERAAAAAHWTARVRSMFTPVLLSILAALALSALGARRWAPDIALEVLGNVGRASVPLSLVLVGASLYGVRAPKRWWNHVWLTVVRLGLLPAAIIGGLALLPLGQEAYRVSVLVALMPVALSTPILALRYGGDPEYAAQAAMITTLASMATIPLGVAWLL